MIESKSLFRSRWLLLSALFACLGLLALGVWAYFQGDRTSAPPKRVYATDVKAPVQGQDASDSASSDIASAKSTVETPHSGKARIEKAPPEESKHKHTNHLIHETSPYLLQHAHNPVNWYPWGPEALAKAKKEGKPIFLSVGYSTCYWCHVMEKQCFEDEEVAALLNQGFIAIKVDREERPDIDEQYMLATHLVTGRGGWPNSIWLTPDGRPWMAGTYFPKTQFMEILSTLSDYWTNRRGQVEASADRLAEAIRKVGTGEGIKSNAGEGGLSEVQAGLLVRTMTQSFDATHGGFGSRPKFPPHGVLRILLRKTAPAGWELQEDRLLKMATSTLDAMWLGGMHDHIGGGFHRYSTDAEWLVPHFEKMLYDNAQLMRSYADAYARTGTQRYREAVQDIFAWLQAEMTSPDGALYSAIDSGEVDKEGETYVWHFKEVLKILGEQDGRLFAEVYNIEESGNFREESTGERPGTNIPHLKAPLDNIASKRGIAPDAFKAKMALLRSKLLSHRNTWVQPHKDTKVLTGWNGLMIGALAQAGLQVDDKRMIEAAGRAADFILKTVRSADGGLLRTYRSGQAKLPAFLDDYAFLAEGLLNLHRATSDRRWREEATKLADAMLARFEDKGEGAFFFTSEGHEDLLMRSKSLTGGGNVPGANGSAVLVLLELERVTGEPKYGQAVGRALDALAGLIRQNPHGMETELLGVLLRMDREKLAKTTSVRKDDADASAKLGPVQASVYVSRQTVRAGEKLRIAASLDIDPGWHLYGSNPNAEFLVPTVVTVEPAPGVKILRTKAPEPARKLDALSKEVLATYEGRVWFLIEVEVARDASRATIPLKVQVRSQACDQSRCLQPRADELKFEVGVDMQGGPERHLDLFKALSWQP